MITKDKCLAMIAKYEQAEIEVLEGKNVMIGNRMFQSESLGEIIKGRQEWERRLLRFNRRSNSPKTIRFI
ncbi:hypothetical protein [Psychromonas arctica]|uniref:hypothetical protein n=1 Tax=Psychromonas arctica TaxID=168275 RepID=UPI002FD0381C